MSSILFSKNIFFCFYLMDNLNIKLLLPTWLFPPQFYLIQYKFLFSSEYELLMQYEIKISITINI